MLNGSKKLVELKALYLCRDSRIVAWLKIDKITVKSGAFT